MSAFQRSGGFSTRASRENVPSAYTRLRGGGNISKVIYRIIIYCLYREVKLVFCIFFIWRKVRNVQSEASVLMCIHKKQNHEGRREEEMKKTYTKPPLKVEDVKKVVARVPTMI